MNRIALRLLAPLVLVASFSTVAAADHHEDHWNLYGRWLGLGWSDGYLAQPWAEDPSHPFPWHGRQSHCGFHHGCHGCGAGSAYWRHVGP